MTVSELTGLLFVSAYLAALLGSVTGLGGGIVLVPVLVLAFHVRIHYAMAAALISVIATSSWTTASPLHADSTNLRIGMFLEAAAVVGAVAGAFASSLLPSNVLSLVFGVILLFSAYLAFRRAEDSLPEGASHAWALKLDMEGTHETQDGPARYPVRDAARGLGLIGIAGLLSGLLGIGSGAATVFTLDRIMRLPYRVSTTTSSFMIGITAAASAGVYFSRGYVHPAVTMPVILGVLLGALSGRQLFRGARSQPLRVVYSVLILGLGIQMIRKAFGAPF